MTFGMNETMYDDKYSLEDYNVVITYGILLERRSNIIVFRQ